MEKLLMIVRPIAIHFYQVGQRIKGAKISSNKEECRLIPQRLLELFAQRSLAASPETII